MECPAPAGGYPTRRRIQALDFDRYRHIPLLEAGGETHEGEMVMVILEASDLSLFYCYTHHHGSGTSCPSRWRWARTAP